MSRDLMLAEHVQELLDERDYWLAIPPPDALPITLRQKQAEIIGSEIAEAVELLRKAGEIK